MPNMIHRAVAAVGLVLLLTVLPRPCAATTEEQRLIIVLQSDAAPQMKDAACARLKRIGTARSVPALASLLVDEQLSHSARYALESMPCPEAGRALAEAMKKTIGPTRVGIINSIGARAATYSNLAEKILAGSEITLPAIDDFAELPDLEKLLSDADPVVAGAAATALGQIGSQTVLMAALAKNKNGSGTFSPEVNSALTDATLRCANSLLAADGKARALDLFRKLYDSQPDGKFRAAAYRGIILSSSVKASVTLITKAIAGKNGPNQVAALQLVHDPRILGVIKALVQLLPKVDPPVQTALIAGLAQRGDFSAMAGIARLADSPVSEVRLAVLNALDILGDASNVPLLARAAASTSDEAERAAARQALIDLHRGDVTAALLAQLNAATPAVQAEAARALGERGDAAAISPLQDLARQGPESARKAALQALAALVDAPQLSALVQLVVEAKGDAARAQAAEALNSACQRIQSRHGQFDSGPLTAALARGSVELRVALLPVCSGLNGPEIRAALRAAVADLNLRVRPAGIRALCDTGDAELLPDLVKVACEAPEENFRTLATAACRRLTNPEEGARLSNPQRIAVFEPILKTPLNDEQRRLVLAGLAAVPEPQALDLVEPMLGNVAVQAEAAQAIIRIAAALPPTQAQRATEALKKVIAATTAAAMRDEVAAALQHIENSADFITTWQVAGPYTQEGKECTALFDVVFPPESGDGQVVFWKPLLAGLDPKRPWVMDLLKALGGEQRVVYARTWVHTDQEQPLRLEIGSDDGVKVWLNHKLIHANNALRALSPGSDKIDVRLNAGWNLLLLKVTQFNQGWAFCARFREPDGSHPAGLQFDASGEKSR